MMTTMTMTMNNAPLSYTAVAYLYSLEHIIRTI